MVVLMLLLHSCGICRQFERAFPVPSVWRIVYANANVVISRYYLIDSSYCCCFSNCWAECIVKSMHSISVYASIWFNATLIGVSLVFYFILLVFSTVPTSDSVIVFALFTSTILHSLLFHGTNAMIAHSIRQLHTHI